MELTDAQQRLFDFLAERIQEDGRSPSLRETAAALGVTHTAVAQLINQLERKGMLARSGHYGRQLVLGPAPVRAREDRLAVRAKNLPVIGQVTAGLPMYAQQVWDGAITVDSGLFPGANLFCLRIRGDSMQGAGILNGDLVICEPRQYAENGEIVAVLIHNEEATVKRFFLHPDHIELRPDNEAYQSMHLQFNEVLVQGKVVGLVRSESGTLPDPRSEDASRHS